MSLHVIAGRIPERLRGATAAFDRRFDYPFGDSGRFHVSHGDGSDAFFRSMGETVRFVAERAGAIVGTLAAVRRRVSSSGGYGCDALYLCDLKILPGEGRALARLAGACAAYARARGVAAAYGVVMDGTVRTPANYSGRLGIPSFDAVGRLTILRLETVATGEVPGVRETSCESVEAAFRSLSADVRYASENGSAIRSRMTPAGLITDDGGACGVLEDTRRGKVLVAPDGGEILAAHLSRFAAGTPDAGAVLLREAASRAGRAGFTSLFAAMPERLADPLLSRAGDLRITAAGATVFACGFDGPGAWNVSSSEI